MRSTCRFGLSLMVMVLMLALLPGCAGSGDRTDSDEPVAEQGETAETDSGEAAAEPETEVTGMPEGFPADVPVHPGNVSLYEPMEVTEDTTVHQLTVESSASFDDVIAWYDNDLPAGWSVGFLEADDDGSDREGKIALNGGSYTPASEDGLGGGVLIGVFEGEPTVIVTTVTVMGAP